MPSVSSISRVLRSKFNYKGSDGDSSDGKESDSGERPGGGGKHSIDGILGDTKSEEKSDVEDDDDDGEWTNDNLFQLPHQKPL